jgi:two-component system, OmpR family, sensor histidine kinase CiaH
MTGKAASGASPDVGMLRRVRWRLVAWSAGLTVLLMLGLGTTVYLVVHASLQSSAAETLQRRADLTEQRLITLPGDLFRRRPIAPFPDIGLPLGAAIFGGSASGTVTLVVDQTGVPLNPLQSGLIGLPVADGVQAALSAGEDLREAVVESTPVRVLSRRVTINGEPFVVQVVQDRTAEDQTLTLLVTIMGGGAAVAVALAIGLGFFFAGRALVPIRTSLRHQRDFAADASHELRTPLAVLSADVSELRQRADRRVGESTEVIDEIDAEVRKLTTLVDELLLLARSDSGAAEIRWDRLDFSDVAAEALHRLSDVAAKRGVQLRLDAVPATVQGDPDRLAQLVTILADNAIRFSPDNGTVTVTVTNADGRVRWTVDDEGPGIRAEDLPRVFDRFWRAADAPPGGSGLGLAIAAWIVERHHGQVTAGNRPEGGARFEVSLPAG